MSDKIFAFFDKIEEIKIVKSIRNGLVMILPILTIGSISLIMQTLPIPVYQSFVTTFMNGVLYSLFVFIHNATFGVLSVFMVISIAICYAKELRSDQGHIYSSALTALICFFILSGVLSENFILSYAFGARGTFTAIFSALTATALYDFINERIRRSEKIYADGATIEFNNSVRAIAPTLLVCLVFAISNYLVIRIFAVEGFSSLFMLFSDAIFEKLGRNIFSGFLFVFISSFVWFFGIHGNDVLENVAQNIFAPALLLNQASPLPTEVLTKTFFDVFVFMGGCGGALSLLLSIFLFSKRKSNLRIAQMATLPMLFNINELLVFGLPIIFNPIMLIPFILTPLVSFFISYLSIYIGLVPMTTTGVMWTTPILFSGYLATGSVRGSILQLICFTLGVLIYRPFVKMYDLEKAKHAKRLLQELVVSLQKSEESCEHITLTELKTTGGSIAKYLVYELRSAIENNEIQLYYQPQFDSEDRCIGAEALLRWNHSLYGMIYPPLVIKIAEEAGFLFELESYIFKTATGDLGVLSAHSVQDFSLSINICVPTIKDEKFQALITEQSQLLNLAPRSICLEITEQMALRSEAHTDEIFLMLSKMGILTAIDDFSMGHTSMRYLQENHFDLVKLDGNLVKSILTNPRSKDIIASIVYLAHSLDFEVLAEYVETKEQRDLLQEIGCLLYQGFYYSPALPLDEYLAKYAQVEDGKNLLTHSGMTD